jgi:TonB family protein
MMRRTYAAAGVRTLFAVAILTVVTAPAHARWRERPSLQQLVTFTNDADSAAILSIVLPDSGAAGTRYDGALLDAATVRARVSRPREWARTALAAALADARDDATCRCDLVRDAADTAGVIVPVVEVYVRGEAVRIPIVLRDSCARVLLPQGPWGSAPLRSRQAELLKLAHEALPEEPAFAVAAVAPHVRPRPSTPAPAPRNAPAAAVEVLPVAVDKAAPEYPDAARAHGMYGTVIVNALVGKDGAVRETRVAWSLPYLDDSAVAAVRKWRFTPATTGGTPVAVWVTIPVRFTLH